MKAISTIILLLISTSLLAQTDSTKTGKPTIIRICAPSREQLVRQPLYVIVWKGKEIYRSDTTIAAATATFNLIKPQQIKSIRILKDKTTIAPYGDIGKNGVIEITLDHKKYPKARKAFGKDPLQ